jgi:hypothetical protein
MTYTTAIATRRAEDLVKLLEIPDSHYQLASDRYRSIGEWLQRPASKVAAYEPAVCPQGSFRYGTVIRPLLKSDEYDLDAVAELLLLTKGDKSQRDVKHLLGDEIKAYATAMDFKDPPEEKNRCWRLDYADHVKFHIDVLPAIPDDDLFKQSLARIGVDPELALSAIAITDRRHPAYATIQRDWPRSNPKGFAKWFEQRMRQQAERRLRAMLEQRALASIDDVPTWEWKTSLQRAIQILKRHRDVMFKDNCDVAPISMILTTLAAHAYEGEDDLYEALVGILDRMTNYIRSTAPRIPNPVNPAEDFADRWKSDSRLEPNFWKWHMRAKADMEALPSHLSATEVRDYAQTNLRLDLNDDTAKALASDIRVMTPSRSSAAAPILIASAPKPWSP